MQPTRRPRGLDSLLARIVQPTLAWRRGRLGGRYVAAYERAYHQSRTRLAEINRHGLQAILTHAFRTVPFWRRHMQAVGLVPADLASPEVLKILPVLTRTVAIKHMGELLSRAYPREALVQMRTGGTTGDPLPLFHDRASAIRKSALTEVLRRKMGWFSGARAAYLWGAAQDLPPADRPWHRRIKEDFVLERIERTLLLPSNRLAPEDLPRHRRRLLRFRPDVLQGYPSATDHLARWLLGRGEMLEIPLVVLTAEPVLEAQRARIAEALHARVLSFYGSRENGWIASECPRERRLHANTLGVYLERAEDGRLLVTDLLNRGMPLIRYDIGDRGALDPDPCPCGDPRPVLARLEGRTLDVFVLPSGKLVPGVVPDVRGLYVDRQGVIDAQFVQNDLHTLDVYWVAGPGCDAGALERFRQYTDHCFEGELRLHLHQVERIEPEANGKVRGCICRVPLP